MELGVSGDIRKIRSNSMIEVVTLKNFQLGRVHVALAQFPVGDTSLIGLKVLEHFVLTVSPREKYISLAWVRPSDVSSGSTEHEPEHVPISVEDRVTTPGNL